MRVLAEPVNAVIPAKAGIHLDLSFKLKSKMDYTPLLRRALRASFAVRYGVLPSQSRFRGNDELERMGP
jgi:hypothetical protein